MNIKFLRRNFDKISTFIYLERYVNEGSRTYSALAQRFEGNPKYHPVRGARTFRVPCLKVPREKVVLYLDNPDSRLVEKYIKHDTILMPVHPEIFKDDKVPFIKELRNYVQTSMLVAPAASTRTVLTFVEPHFIKLNYPRYISRFTRQMTRDIIQNSIEVSKGLAHISVPNFGFLPETIGVAFGEGPDSWGFIVRETFARPQVENKRFLIPLFALYSRDLNDSSDLPLIIQLIELHQAEPLNFTLEYIMKPIITIWCTFLRQAGFLFEMHGENTLLELDENFLPSRIIYRDLDIDIDIEMRNKLSLHTEFPKTKHITNEHEKTYSLAYDGFIGHHLFDYMSEELQKYYGVSPRALQKKCQEHFYNNFPDADKYFKNQVYYYAKELGLDDKYPLVATKNKPKWR